jgi:hypothetical protein
MQVLFSSPQDDGNVQVEITVDNDFYTIAFHTVSGIHYYQEVDPTRFMETVQMKLCKDITELPVSLYWYVIRSLAHDIGLPSYKVNLEITAEVPAISINVAYGGVIATYDTKDDDTIACINNALSAAEVLNVPQTYQILQEKCKVVQVWW